MTFSTSKRILLLLFVFSASILACTFNIEKEPSTRWNSPLDMAMRVPSFSLLRGQILILHLPFDNKQNEWKIEKSGKNEYLEWVSKSTATDQELRIKALQSGSYVFPVPFRYGNDTARVMITLSIDSNGVTPDLNPLKLTLANNNHTFENHPQSPIVIRLDNPKGERGVWKYISTIKSDIPLLAKSYTNNKKSGMEFSFSSSSQYRELKFYFVNVHQATHPSKKATFYIHPMKEIPKC